MNRPLLPSPRDVVNELPVYRTSPEPDTPIRFRASSNEAPFGPSPVVRSAMIDVAPRGHLYPAPYGRGLVAALSRATGIDQDRVAADSGSLSLLNHILLAYAGPGDRVVYAWRSFEAYPISVRSLGAKPVEVSNLPDGSHDLEAMTREAQSASVVILCSPNNPTGPAITREQLLSFLAAVPGTTLVVFDEAYIDFVVEGRFDSLTMLDAHPNLLVLRTFSKCYSLAGVRAGYCFAHPEVISNVQRVMPAFPLSEVGVVAATAALADREWHRRVVDSVVAERAAMTEMLRSRGYPVTDSQGNFVWLPLGSGSEEFATTCALNGVLVRPFAGEGVRITVGEPGLARVLAEFLPAYASAD